ncbi:hypothetical protein BGW41_004409 [Actinomortierella wolfii]|nr:hypothetical protein BGW41_004409 [Actinomortierella wolfii]
MSGTKDTDNSSASSENSYNHPKKSFMSSYMSDLNQSQDNRSFLQQNQPTFTSPDQRQRQTPPNSTSSSGTTATAAGTQATTTATLPKPAFNEATTIPGAHPLPTGHSKEQKQAIHKGALDNCADLNLELTDCLMGRSGSWWDRASMCMRQKERFSKCLRINKEILMEREYGKEGNTPKQDQEILDYADKTAQAALKEEK